MVSVWAIGVDGMVRHHGEERRRARTLQFGFEPSELLALLLGREGEVPAVAYAAIRERHVAVEREKRDDGILRGKLEAVPKRRHGPAGRSCARAPRARIFQFRGDFTVGPKLVVMVSRNRVGGTRKGVLRIHLFKLRLPAGRA